MSTTNINRNKYLKSLNSLTVNNTKVPNEFFNTLSVNSAQSNDILINNGTTWSNGQVVINNILINNPINNQPLLYNGTNWVNSDLSTDSISNISKINIQDNDLLRYNSNSLKFENVSLSLSNLSDVSLSSNITNKLLKYNGSNYVDTDVLFKENSSNIEFVLPESKTIRLGSNSDTTQLGYNDCINIGILAGLYSQGSNCINIGCNFCPSNQSENSIAIGIGYGTQQIGTNSVIICTSNRDGSIYGSYCTAIGRIITNSTANGTGNTNIGDCNAMAGGCNITRFGGYGNSIVGGQLSDYSIIMGTDNVMQAKSNTICLGYNTARLETIDDSAIAIGSSHGNLKQHSIIIGAGSRGFGIYSINIGYRVKLSTPSIDSRYSISIGLSNSFTSQGQYCVSIGNNANNRGASNRTITIGTMAGSNFPKSNSISIGQFAGSNSQGQYTISMGYDCSSTADNSIVFNASTSTFNKTTTGFFIAPGTIQTSNVATNSGELYYIPNTGEIKYASL